MENLRITMVQTDIIWEDKVANLDKQEKALKNLKGETDLVVLPEMFTTGFSMSSHSLAEPENGKTITTLRAWSNTYKFALSGSFICTQNGLYFNRGFFIAPGEEPVFYDKRHLFLDEKQHFSAGSEQTTVSYNGWNIRLAICYDLRFPIWLHNHTNLYDLLLVFASWPKSRIATWDILLQARAIENQSYVCGVNRVGEDTSGLYYPGHSALIEPKGNILQSTPEEKEAICTITLSKESLLQFRKKFPVLQDSDNFTIHI